MGGGAAGGFIIGGGAAGGFIIGGGAAGGFIIGGGAAGGFIIGGGAAGGFIIGGGAAGGFIIGGGAAGGFIIGGGAAGGSIGGGAAGGSVMIDAYVCGNCPGANDSNPGTQQAPVATIGRGIQNAITANLPVVFVASRYSGSDHIYAEDITMVQGRSLQGRWSVTMGAGGLVWSRASSTTPRTTLQNTQATGLKFPAGITSATSVDGFIVRQASFAANRVIGIQVSSSSPTLREVSVLGPLLSGPLPQESVGIDVIGGFAGGANPTLASGATMGRNTISPMGGLTLSTALQLTSASAQVTATDFTGGSAGSASRGAYLSDGVGSTFQDSTFSGGLAQSCFGLLSQGQASGVLLERVTAIGCPRSSGTTVTPRLGYGVAFDACPLSPGSTNPIVRNSTVSGGVTGGGTNTAAIGGSATDGCDVRFEGTGGAGVSSTYTGLVMAPPGQAPESAVGIICSYRGLRTMTGRDARCSVSGSSLFGSASASVPRSYGLACEGSCATGTSTCLGSCGEVVNNSITAQAGAQMAHVIVTNSSPQVRQNRIGFGGNGTNCINPGTQVRGVETYGAGGAFVNNLILGGPCSTAIGVEQMLARRPDNSVPTTTFHSNTIGGSPPFGSLISSTLVSVGVSLIPAPGGPSLNLQSGTWRNNVIFAGPIVPGMGSRQAAFEERAPSVDPLVVQNNLFHVFSPPMVPPLYVNEGATIISTASGINTLMDMVTGGNVAGDPLFTSATTGNYTLLNASSPASRAGTPTGAPTTDLTGTPNIRPSPTGTNPDIGCYEANF